MPEPTKTFCERRPQRMHMSMAIVVTTTLVAARGGVPGALTCAGGGFVHHTQTPCSPIRYHDAQAHRATNGTQATGGPSQPQGTHPLIPNPTDGWQVCSKASRGPHSPVPTALRPPRAVPSATNTTGTATRKLRSPDGYRIDRTRCPWPAEHKTRPVARVPGSGTTPRGA